MSPFTQFVTLPIADGAYDRAIAVLEPVAAMIRRDVPGCLELVIYKSQDSATNKINITLYERFVDSEAHQKVFTSAVFADMMKPLVEEKLLRGEPVPTTVSRVGGFMPNE
ncbi:hypothetical protein PFICI_14664 [Pestalotiopsis fici W106-1]|uniref:ABM domain-containing protein n=1 Tax=Pestalotiopsis fici (strain W106-1 / CGMCC3.15140) TaxID=1229662 RepID=W3WIL1_PESFW|nr:uncharacterized protein PFICI_14664 [Pestalotiopsis fici W106-1]ETS73718.1 hypothetical protein PFICI_14664 [Pestalotiopsis fici W106-1]